MDRETPSKRLPSLHSYEAGGWFESNTELELREERSIVASPAAQSVAHSSQLARVLISNPVRGRVLDTSKSVGQTHKVSWSYNLVVMLGDLG